MGDKNMEEWGWEEDVCIEPNEGVPNKVIIEEKSNPSSPTAQNLSSLKKNHSMSRNNSLDQKQIALSIGSQSLQKGITSSPSFQELEKAIGAQLAMSLTPDELSSNINSNHMNGKNNNKSKQLSHGQRNLSSFTASYKQNANITSADILAQTKIELESCIWESESRAIILLHSPDISVQDVKNGCQKFGLLYYLRQEFHHKGVTFLCYFDLRSATRAYSSLSEEVEVEVKYSIMLHSSNSNSEEFKLIITSIPLDGHSEYNINTIFSRYGALRSIQQVFHEKDTSTSNSSSNDVVKMDYVIEYFNIQDARHAASEVLASASQIWDHNTVNIKFSPVDIKKQQLCSQLLTTLSRWRSETTNQYSSVQNRHPYPTVYIPVLGHQGAMSLPYHGSYSRNTYNDNLDVSNMPQYGSPYPVPMQIHVPYYFAVNDKNPREHTKDEYYSLHNHINGSNKTEFKDWNNNAKQQLNINPNLHIFNHSIRQKSSDSRPLHHTGNIPGNSIRHMKQNNINLEPNFSLDLNSLLTGSDARTTIMVRNIPNKYNQIMLLEEVNLNHEGTYDFFYLPIDFKNKCNVGYCFINFLEPEFIVPFVNEFNGRRWKSFNSEKVCAVTFARIQGKSAMITRFQNSSLLEKDDEYRPLLFYSTGTQKGKPEPFPNVKKADSVVY